MHFSEATIASAARVLVSPVRRRKGKIPRRTFLGSENPKATESPQMHPETRYSRTIDGLCFGH